MPRLGQQCAEDVEHEERAAHVDAEDGIHHIHRYLLQRAATSDDAGVVDQHVDAAGLPHPLGRRSHRRFVADVEGERGGADLGGDGSGCVGVHVADEHLVAGRAEGGGDAAAEPGRPSGDQDAAGGNGHDRPH